MSKKNVIADGGRAYPSSFSTGGIVYTEHGMSLRAWLAGMAMEGLMIRAGDYASWAGMAVDSVECADALLAELEKDE